MKDVSVTSLLSIFVVIQLSLPYRVIGGTEEDTWLEPDAWAREHLSLISGQSDIGKCCPCSEETDKAESKQVHLPSKQQSKATEDEVSLMYFQKFIKLLFHRNKFNYDSTLQTYQRSIMFTLQASQLDKLHQLQDPRDLDNILTEIFENVRIPNKCYHGRTTAVSSFKALINGIFRDVLQLIKASEVRFLLIALLVVILGWYLNNRYNIGWMTLIFGSLFLFGYLHTYIECNRELEMNKMLEIINRNKETQESQKGSGFFSFLKNIFSSSVDSRNLSEQQKLKKSTKISLDFCRPDHVIIMYFNDIFLKYLHVLLEQCSETLTKLKNDLPFPFNYFAVPLLICMVGYILKLTFKYILSPSAWLHFVHRNNSHSPASQHQPALNSHNDDRLSGDNLRILLNAINSGPQRNHISPAVSGVEELKEALAPAPNQTSSSLDESLTSKSENSSKSEKDTSSSSESSSLKLENNNDSKKIIKNVDAQVTYENLSKDS